VNATRTAAQREEGQSGDEPRAGLVDYPALPAVQSQTAMTRAEIETRLQEVADETLAVERELRKDDPESIEDHRARLALLATEQRVFEGLLAAFDQGEAIARSS